MDNDELYRLLSEDIREIKNEVRETNGRVTRLEMWRATTVGTMRALIAVAALPSLVLTVALLVGLR